MRPIFYKTILLLTLFTCSAAARSQILISILFGDKLNSDKLVFGLQLSYGVNDMSGIGQADKLGRFNLGLFFCFKLSNKFYLQAEGLAKYGEGAKGITPYSTGDSALDQKFTNGSIERRINYMSLPVTLQYRIFNYVNIEAGFQANLRIGAKDVFAVGDDNELVYTKDIRDEINTIGMGLLAGLNYQLGGGTAMKLGARYYYGVTDVMNSISGSQLNRSLQFYASIPIGRKKTTKE